MDFHCAAPDRYKMLKEFAKENLHNMTLAESVLWQQLRLMDVGTRFNRQFIIGDYIVDFVSQRGGLVIEVDGGYHAELEQKERDGYREKALEGMGFHVMRFSNEEVLYDTDSVLKQIENYFND